MNNKKEILIAVPIILVKEGEHFIISCDTLGVYAQSKSKEEAEEGFRKTLETFFNSIAKRISLVDFLYAKNLIHEPKQISNIKIQDIPQPKLGLGLYTNFQVPALATC